VRRAALALLLALTACASYPPPGERLEWWTGYQKVIARDGRKLARDTALHAAAGAVTATAGRYATGDCRPGIALAFSLGPGAAREVYQLARSGAPHLLDRLVDVLGWGAGGAAAWSLYRLGCH